MERTKQKEEFERLRKFMAEHCPTNDLYGVMLQGAKQMIVFSEN